MPRRTKQQWQELIDAHKRSGLSASEFCRQHEINAKYFSLRKQQLQGSDKNNFVQLVPSGVTEPEAQGKAIKVRLIEFEVSEEGFIDSLSMMLDGVRR